MAFGAVLGGLVQAGGSIAGAELGQASFSQGQQTFPSLDPRNNIDIASQSFDALNQIGFGDINDIPSPYARLVGQINSLPLDEKTKRRGLISLQEFMAGSDAPNLGRYLNAVLARVGLNISDLGRLRTQQSAFLDQQAGLQKLAGINQSTVLNRASAAQAAAKLLGDAANVATGGQRSELDNQILNRINRSIDQSEERTLLQGQFGGFNPSAGLEGIANLRADSQLRALEQSLMMSSGITSALSGGLSAAQISAQISSGANQGALSIAAGQAQAANALQSGVNINNSDSRAAGYGGAFGSVGQGITIASILNSRDQGATSPGFSDGGGFNPNISSGFTSSALSGRGVSG